MGSIFRAFFDIDHITTPIAIEQVKFKDHNRKYKIVYFFGIRIAVMNIS